LIILLFAAFLLSSSVYSDQLNLLPPPETKTELVVPMHFSTEEISNEISSGLNVKISPKKKENSQNHAGFSIYFE